MIEIYSFILYNLSYNMKFNIKLTVMHLLNLRYSLTDNFDCYNCEFSPNLSLLQRVDSEFSNFLAAKNYDLTITYMG